MRSATNATSGARGNLGEKRVGCLDKKGNAAVTKGKANANDTENDTENDIGNGSGNAASSNPAATARYTVLYYKRKNKVHKSRGVSKLDGVLIVNESSAPKVSVTLLSSDAGAVVYKGNTNHHHHHHHHLKCCAGADGTGVDDGQSFGFAVDETVSVGAYEVEILSRDDSDRAGGTNLSRNHSDPLAGRLPGARSNRSVASGAKPRRVGIGSGGGRGIGSGSGRSIGSGNGLSSQRTVGLGHRTVGTASGNGTGLRRGIKRPLADAKRRTLPGDSSVSSAACKPASETSNEDDNDNDNDKDNDNDNDEEMEESIDGIESSERNETASSVALSIAGAPRSKFRKPGLGLGFGSRPAIRKGLGHVRSIGGTKPRISRPGTALSTTGVATAAATATTTATVAEKATTAKATTATTATARPKVTPSLPNLFPGAIGNLDVPHSIRTKLRPHQIRGVEFLWNCLTGNGKVATVSPHIGEENGDEDEDDDDDDDDDDDIAIPSFEGSPKGCILGDEMGLGKTMMTIATISALHRQKRTNRFVVVCPSSLVNNWAREFDKWLGKVGLPKRVVVRKGGKEGLSQLLAFNAVKPTNTSEVLIVSYDLFRTKASVLENAQNVALLVVDEGHRLKNTAGSQTMTALLSLPCEARLCITATPIQNHLGDVHTIVDFVCPGVLGDLATFRREYERPIAKASHKHATAEQKRRGREQSRVLDRILRSLMLRRLQKDVLKQSLPPRHVCLLFCRPTTEQRELYRTVAGGHTFGGSSSQEHLAALTGLRKVCTHPGLLGANSDENGTAARDTGLRCEASGKLRVLRQLVEELRATAPADKLVIVSNFTSTLTVVEECVLKPLKLSFLRLDGSLSSADRQPLVDAFNRTSADANFALTLSSKAGGVGLNVTGANRLVMVDPDWNPATDIQAMARIYREGQKKPCFIYRCFTTGTIEEVILQKQIQKESIATTTMDAARKARDKGNGLNAEELRDCFTLKDERCKCDTRNKLGTWPDYDGKESLIARDCADAALLALAERSERTDSLLSFVHMVGDDEEDSCRESAFDREDDAPGRKNFDPSSDTDFDTDENDDDSSDEDAHGRQNPGSGTESSDEEYEFE